MLDFLNNIYSYLYAYITSSINISLAFLVQISVLALLCFVINTVISRVLNKVESNLNSRKNIWDKSLIAASIVPIKISVWLIFFNYLIKLSNLYYPNSIIIAAVGHYVRSIGLIIIITWFLLRLVKHLEINYFAALDSNTTLDNASSYLLGKIARICIFVISSIIILHTLDYNITTLLTVGGAGSIIVGLAAKDILANFFGGLMVYLDKPFKVGDMIKTDQFHLEGVVEKIGWRSTRLRNFDKRPIYIPNNIWSTAPVENITRMVNRRIKEMIGVRYKDASKIEVIIKDLEEMLANHEGVDHRQNLIVKFSEFGPSSLNIMVYVFTKDTKLKDFLTTKQDIFLKIIAIIHKNGADFAFPTTTLDMPAQELNNITVN